MGSVVWADAAGVKPTTPAHTNITAVGKQKGSFIFVNRFKANVIVGNLMRSFSASAFGAVLAVCLSGCGGCGDADPWTVEPVEDVAAVEELAFVPLHELVRAVPADTAAAVEWFVGHTGVFGADYVETILRLGPVDAGATYVAMQEFAAHPDIAESFRAIDTTSAVAAREAEPALRAAFGRFARHFPSDTLPTVVWMNTAFNVAVYPTATHLGVGLDWFLGPEHPIVGMLAPEVFPAYQRARMDPQYLVTDALRGWMLVHFASNWYDPRTCADEALYRGKIFFMLHRIHPDAASRLWWDWTEEQWAWAEEHEREVWQEFSNAKELLSERRTDYLRWFNEGPFTRAGRIPQESPDQLGTYIAWRAVEDYMAAHPETTLPELLALRDPVPVFKAYRP